MSFTILAVDDIYFLKVNVTNSRSSSLLNSHVISVLLSIVLLIIQSIVIRHSNDDKTQPKIM